MSKNFVSEKRNAWNGNQALGTKVRSKLIFFRKKSGQILLFLLDTALLCRSLILFVAQNV